MAKERLDKIIASQGMRTRKQARALICGGKVKVNGAVERHIDFKVDPLEGQVSVDGEVIEYKKHVYLMMNKPAGVISAATDPNIQTVIDILPEEFHRKNLFPAGRLDRDTQGLLVITDDGDFAHKMLAPKKGVYKIYYAELDQEVSQEDRVAFEQGIVLDGKEQCRPAVISMLENCEPYNAEIRICEGKYHQVKRMAAAVGKKVIRLKRIQIGGLTLDPKLPPGGVRELTDSEIGILIKN